jgi:hypothetical protein
MEGSDVTITMVPMTAITWVIYLSVAAVGGFASSLINNKGAITRIGWDGRDKTRIRMGVVTDIVVAFAAALAILWIMTRQTPFQLIGIGAVAGYGGSAVLQALLNRIVADISKEEKDKVEAEKKTIEAEKKELEKERDEIVEREKSLDKSKALISIMERIAETKRRI